jgi:LuxR family maltose regulon positive regulatory protein
MTKAIVNSHLLATKLRPPAVPSKRTQRPHLVRRLNDGLEAGRQITLLSAPAGFGKTAEQPTVHSGTGRSRRALE